jgi:hypothetical protein
MADDQIMVAEFRADRDLVPKRPPLSPLWTSDLYTVEGIQISQTVGDPLLLTNRELGGTWQRAIVPGYQALSAVFDYKYQQSLWGDRPYRHTQSFKFGPSFSVAPGFSTRLYYGVKQDYITQDVGLYGLAGDVERLSTGLAQTWYLSARDAALQLGYEFEQGTSEEAYERMQGHRINVSGSFPLAWGFNAALAAGYSWYSYPESGGSLEQQSDRLSVNAGISRMFSTRLSGSLQFNYADEEFDDSPLSYRRHTWGLNFRYRY